MADFCGTLLTERARVRLQALIVEDIADAVAAERERCAKIAETAIDPSTDWVMLASQVPAVIAKKIRSGK